MSTSVRRLRIPNPNLTQSEITQLSQNYTSGNDLYVLNNEVFSANDYVVLGLLSEKGEAKAVASKTSTNQITFGSALNFDHVAGATVYRSEFNQLEIDRFRAGVWTTLDTIAIQWDKQDSLYIDQGGVSSDAYRFRFKNEASGNYSEYSPTVGGGGFSKNQIGYRLNLIRKRINDPERKIVSDEDLIQQLNEAKDIIKGLRSDWWFWRKEDEGTITTVANQRKYNLDDISEDIEYVRDVRFQDSSQATVERYPLYNRSTLEMDDLDKDQSNPETDDQVTDYTIEPGDQNSTAGYLRVYPLPKTTGNGSFYVRYYEPDAEYTSVSDEIGIPIPSILDNYALSYAFRIKGDDNRADVHEGLFYGPAEARKRISRPTGIAVLEKMQASKLKPTAKAQVLKKFMGRNYYQRVTSSRTSSASWDARKEKYWTP